VTRRSSRLSDRIHGGPDCRISQVVEGPIPFFSLCEHHSLPFYGHAHIGYIAHEHILGLSKLTRLVRLYAKRFSVQERIGQQLADARERILQPHGVAVPVEAVHLCTQMRGVRESDSNAMTSATSSGRAALAKAASFIHSRFVGVSMMFGMMALTRTRERPSSSASTSVSFTRAAFARQRKPLHPSAGYSGSRADIHDCTATCIHIHCAAARQDHQAVSRFRLIMKWNWSGGVSSTVPPRKPPATFTSADTPP
jgi:hypothetical protein